MEEPTGSYEKLYEENAKVAHAFWEWRHKILTRFFLVIASVFILAGWMIQNDQFQKYVFTPFLLGMIYSFISQRMDSVNTWILRYCYDIGSDLEVKLSGTPSIFGAISSNYETRKTYGKLLKVIYISAAVVLFGISIYSFLVFTI